MRSALDKGWLTQEWTWGHPCCPHAKTVTPQIPQEVKDQVPVPWLGEI